MKILVIILFLFSLLACSGGSKRSTKSQIKNQKKVVKKTVQKKKIEDVDDENTPMEAEFDETEEEKAESGMMEEPVDDEDETNTEDEEEFTTRGRIKKISFEPKAIMADSDLKVFPYIVPGPSDNETIMYSFIVNGKVVVSQTPNTVFKKGQYKKGDIVEVNVMIVRDDTVMEERKAEPQTVRNSNPEIVSVPPISVSGFKTYTFDVTARDIDRDIVTFELEGDIPPGMTIDQYTGRITYVFSDKPEKDKYVFNIVALDPDGGKAIREVSIGFREEVVKEGE